MRMARFRTGWKCVTLFTPPNTAVFCMFMSSRLSRTGQGNQNMKVDEILAVIFLSFGGREFGEIEVLNSCRFAIIPEPEHPTKIRPVNNRFDVHEPP